MILSQINKQKKIKALRFRNQNLKYNLIWFLKEFNYEQALKQSRRDQLIQQVQRMKLQNIFSSILNVIENKQKKVFLNHTLEQNYKRKVKQDVFMRLVENIEIQQNIREFEYMQLLRFKKEMFDNLRYSVRKQ